MSGVQTRLDDTTLVVRILMRFQRRGGRKRIVTPDGTAIVTTSKPQPVAGRTRDGERLLVIAERLLDFAESSPGEPEIAERGALAAAITHLPRDGEPLLVEADCLPDLAEIGPGKAEIAERGALAAPVARAPAGLDRTLEPSYAHLGRQAEVEDVSASAGVLKGEVGGGVARRQPFRRPFLSRLDVSGHGVEQREPSEDVVSALQVELISPLQELAGMHRVPLRPLR